MLSDYNDWFEYIIQNNNIWPINLDIFVHLVALWTVADSLNANIIIDNPTGLIKNQNFIFDA